jgi:sarcosine oxidase subunit gamma
MLDQASPHSLIFDGVSAVREDVRIELAAQAARYGLRAREPATLAAAIGRPLPERIGETLGGVARLGPDEWFARLPVGQTLPDCSGAPVSVVELSARNIGIAVDGPSAARLIGAGCPLDLERMAVGRATRTVFETVEILLWREGESHFHIDVWRSFAPWLWHALISSRA